MHGSVSASSQADAIAKAVEDLINDPIVPFGEQDGRTAAKCLCIDLMRRDQRQNVLEHCLFAAIVGNRGSHSLLFY